MTRIRLAPPWWVACAVGVFTLSPVDVAWGLLQMPMEFENASFRDREQALAVAQLTGYDKRIAPENVSVEVSINFDNIQGIDLKEGSMSLIIWYRLIWQDKKLAWDDTQWNLGRSFRSGDEIWTPDVVFYNGLQVQDALSPMSAQISPDGSMFWSRPGRVSILCNFEGLENFPRDELSCGIDLSSWYLDGIEQNIIPWGTDGGYDWAGKGGEAVANGFQDYHFKKVSVQRVENFYSCCPGRPYIMLKYKIQFTRSTSFYFEKLVMPQVVVAGLSWLTFWMHPEVGERLGFGITLILTAVAFDWVASEHTPICDQALMLNVLTQGVSVMIIFSLIESTIILYIYFWKAWTFEHYIPYPIWLIWNFCKRRFGTHETELSKKIKLLGSVPETEASSNDTLVSDSAASSKDKGAESAQAPMTRRRSMEFLDRASRIRLYRRAFFMLDADYTAHLDRDEINHFGEFMMGKNRWTEDLLNLFMKGNDHLTLTQFCDVCDAHLHDPATDDEKKLEALVEAFTQSLERADESERAVSQSIANTIDKYCRWLVPPVEVLIMALIINHDFVGTASS